MPHEFASWPRPNFVPGAGQPFLLFAAFGLIDLRSPIDRAAYRAAGVPAGCELLLFDRSRQPSSFEQLAESGAWALAASESPELESVARAAPQFAYLRGMVQRADTLDYLRDAVGIVQYLCDRGARTIFDPHTLQFWSPADWRTRLFAPAAPVPHEHVLILETPDDDGDLAWIHTRGLRKFGRPDLSVHGIGPAHRDRVVECFNHLVDHFASGGMIHNGDRIELIGHAERGTVRLDPNLDHPDFHNSHAEIEWPGEGLV